MSAVQPAPGTGDGVDRAPDGVPAWLAPHRDLGPLEGALTRSGRLPVPQVVLAAVAASLLAVPALLRLTEDGGAGPAWVWAAVSVGLATLAMVGRRLPRLDWPLPALLRAIEYGTVLLLAGDSPWSYLLLAVLAAHHYGIVYRVRLSGDGPQRWLTLVTGGWPLRCVVVVVAAATGPAEVAVAVLALVMTPLILADGVVSWYRLGR